MLSLSLALTHTHTHTHHVIQREHTLVVEEANENKELNSTHPHTYRKRDRKSLGETVNVMPTKP